MFICRFCGISIVSISKIEYHVKIHHKSYWKSIGGLSAALPEPNMNENHEDAMTNNNMDIYTKLEEYQNTSRKYIYKTTGMLICKMCGESFSTMGQTETHFKIKHNTFLKSYGRQDSSFKKILRHASTSPSHHDLSNSSTHHEYKFNRCERGRMRDVWEMERNQRNTELIN